MIDNNTLGIPLSEDDKENVKSIYQNALNDSQTAKNYAKFKEDIKNDKDSLV